MFHLPYIVVALFIFYLYAMGNLSQNLKSIWLKLPIVFNSLLVELWLSDSRKWTSLHV